MTASKKKPAKTVSAKPAASRVRLPGLTYSAGAARKAKAQAAKAPARKPAPAKKAPAKKPAPAKKAPAKKPAPAPKKAPAKKPAPAPKKAPAKKPAPAPKKAPAKKPAPAPAPKKAPAKKPVPVKKAPAPAPKPAPKPVKPGKPHLSKTELAALRAAMMEERAKFAVRAGSLKEQSLTRPDEENPEEAGTDAITIVTELGKANSGERRINQIDEALRAIARGDYGLCQNCGAKIPIERLRVMPDAKYCVPCQEELDRDGPGRSPWAQAPSSFE